jgi:uncharacterized protein
MKLAQIVWSAAALVLLAGCAASPGPAYFTLSHGQASPLPQGKGPSIIITQTNLPELIDRPQLVIRQPDNRVSIDEQRRWAEPLRREIPRIVADELGHQLDSGRVFSLPIDAQRFEADFRLLLDVQRLDVVAGQGAFADVVWRIQPQQGKSFIGRSVLSEKSTSEAPEDRVEAQQRVLKGVAAEIAGQIRQMTSRAP